MTGEWGSAGSAGDGYRVPPPREPVDRRWCDDPNEPGAHRQATPRTAAVPRQVAR